MKKMINMPIPTNINNWWNLGSMLSMSMTIQTTSGTLMFINLMNKTTFQSIINNQMNSNYGWTMRMTHSNLASFMFMMLYMHFLRNKMFNLTKNKKTWMTGVTLFILMATSAFSGYILPWSQMSFWGTTVITNTLSTIPLIGNKMTMWMWGNHNINYITLNRALALHFLTPLTMTMMIMIHMKYLHEKLSSNPMGTKMNDIMTLNPSFLMKDTTMMMTMMMIMTTIINKKPFLTNDPDNFTLMNPMITPKKIQPEWYFLFLYSILRSTPNKMGGMILTMMMLTLIMTKPMTNKQKFQSNKFYPTFKMKFWIMTQSLINLSWLSTKTMEEPFTSMNKMMLMTLITSMMTMNQTKKKWDKKT